MRDIQVLRTAGEIRSVLNEWRELAATLPQRNFFQDPERILCHLESVGDEGRPVVVIIREDGKIACIAPFLLKRTSLKLKLGVIALGRKQVRQLNFLGDNVIAAQKGETGNYPLAVFGALDGLRDEFDTVYFESLGIADVLYSQLKMAMAGSKGGYLCFVDPEEKDWRMSIAGSFEQYLASLKRKVRSNLKKKIKDFESATGGSFRVERISESRNVEALLGSVDQIFKKCWQSKTYGYYKRNTDQQVQYLQGVAGMNWLRSYLLFCQETPVSYVLGFQYHGKYYYEETGYNLEWARLFPGNVLTYYLIKDLCSDNQPLTLDFGYGDNTYKRIFADDEVAVTNVRLLKDSLLFAAYANAQKALNGVYKFTHALVSGTALEKTLRSLLKRKGV